MPGAIPYQRWTLARRNNNDDDGVAKRSKRDAADRKREQEQELEKEGAEKEAPKPEHARLQDQFGNAMLASMLDQGGTSGGMDIEVEYQHGPKGTEEKGPEFGGDDDIADVQGPILAEDLASSLNPKMKKGDNKLGFTDPMPDDVLPPEDAVYIEAVAAMPAPPLPPSRTWDPLVQPSTDAVRLGLHDWAVACSRWAPASAHWQLLMAGIRHGMPVLQDAHGRVGVARSRTAAIATCGLVAGPSLTERGSAANAAAIDFCTELAARSHRVRTVAATSARDDTGKLPNARDVFRVHAPSASGDVLPRDPSPGAAQAWTTVLQALAGFTDPMKLLPTLTVAQPDPDDDPDNDPLGLDAFLFAETGGTYDPEAGAHTAIMEAAAYLATAAAQTRVRLAGVAIAVAESSLDWSRGAPTTLLDSRLRQVDDEVVEILQTLVEVAQSTQQRSVDLTGLGHGLKRSARAIKRARSRAIKDFVRIIGGVVPRDTLLLPKNPDLPDDVKEALSIGEPRSARRWAKELPDPADRRLCGVLVELCDVVEPPWVAEALEHLVAEWAERDVHFSRALSVILGAVNLTLGRTGEALAIAREQRRDGLRWRNGALYAEGALLGMEAHLMTGDVIRADALRRDAGAYLWQMGARGSLSLLARWTPPDLDD
ncbi:MAG: hypothetical protein ACJATT_002222 [Myxococcota bacterium]